MEMQPQVLWGGFWDPGLPPLLLWSRGREEVVLVLFCRGPWGRGLPFPSIRSGVPRKRLSLLLLLLASQRETGAFFQERWRGVSLVSRWQCGAMKASLPRLLRLKKTARRHFRENWPIVSAQEPAQFLPGAELHRSLEKSVLKALVPWFLSILCF